jgi:hypothetical protein
MNNDNNIPISLLNYELAQRQTLLLKAGPENEKLIIQSGNQLVTIVNFEYDKVKIKK